MPMVYSVLARYMVTILHIETFVTFDFDPSLISRLITDSDLDQIKWIFGDKPVDDWDTELKR